MIDAQIHERGYGEAIQSLTALPGALTAAAASALRTALTQTSPRDYLQNANTQSLDSVAARMRDNASVRVTQEGNTVTVQVGAGDGTSALLDSGAGNATRLRGFARTIERVNGIEEIAGRANPSAIHQPGRVAQGRGMIAPLANVADYANRSFPVAVLEKIQPLVLAALENSTPAN